MRYSGVCAVLDLLLYGPNRVDAVPGAPQELENARTGSSRPRTTPPTLTTPKQRAETLSPGRTVSLGLPPRSLKPDPLSREVFMWTGRW